MAQRIVLLVGVPCSGKTWICSRLSNKYTYLPHDAYERSAYTLALLEASRTSAKPVIAEAPFNGSSLANALRQRGLTVEEWHVTAPLPEIEQRYRERSGKSYPANFATNHKRYSQGGSRFTYSGTSSQIAEILDQLED